MVGRTLKSPPPIESMADNGWVHMVKGGVSFGQGWRGQFAVGLWASPTPCLGLSVSGVSV